MREQEKELKDLEPLEITPGEPSEEPARRQREKLRLQPRRKRPRPRPQSR